MKNRIIMKAFKTLCAAICVAIVCSAAARAASEKFEFARVQSSAFNRALRSDVEDKGDFKIGFAPQKTKNKTAQMDADIAASLQGLADGLNQTFRLPVNVYIGVAECGEPNAFYESSKQQITMCYELFAQLDEVFKPEFKNEAERDDAVTNAFVFIFFHELGHALVDVYELPIAGKEEDAVDGLSTWILTDGTDAGDSMAFQGAAAFALLGDGADKTAELPFWDEHSLNSQRFYNIVCLIYGNNPTKYKSFVKDGLLPKTRAARCANEYAQLDRTWKNLLAPFVKE